MTDSNLVANAVVANASSQYISIVPENGEQFNPQQKIIYNIEPEIGFIKKDSYLVFDILNNSSDFSRVTLNKNLGAHAIIDRVDIYSKETGVLLESNTHYAQWCNIENQYMYDSTNNLSNHQGVGSPVSSRFSVVSGTNVVTGGRTLAGAHLIENNQLSPVDNGANGGAPTYTPRRFCIPLMVGLFGAYEADEKAIPIMPFGGLRIEITLARPEIALQDLGWRAKNIAFNSKDKDRIFDWKAPLAPLTPNPHNDSGAQTLTLKWVADGNHGWTKDLQDTGLCVGNKLQVLSGKDNTTSADLVAGSYAITAITGATAQDRVINGVATSVYTELFIVLNYGATGPNGNKNVTVKKVVSNNNYKVINTEFRLLQVVPPPNVMDGLMKGINYQFTGYEVFFDNVPTASLRHQIPIHSVASKALAVFTMLYDTANDEGQIASSLDMYNGSLPNDIHLNDIVYFINNRLYPLRSYNPQNKKDKVLNTNELVKAFKALGKQPLNLGSADFGDLENYANTPLIARELARNGMVFDLRNAEPELRIAFSQARANILRANTFVFSKKIIQTTATGVQVIH